MTGNRKTQPQAVHEETQLYNGQQILGPSPLNHMATLNSQTKNNLKYFITMIKPSFGKN